MAFTRYDLSLFAESIVEAIKEEFAIKHLSGNLVETIKVVATEKGIEIDIPAETYNMLKYQQDGVIVHTNHGSYASRLNETGSEFYVYPNEGTRKGARLIKPHNHIGFIDRCVDKATRNLSEKLNNKYNVGKVTEYGR